MKIELWQIGKTKAGYLETGISDYTKRLKRYARVDLKTVADVKNPSKLRSEELKSKEAEKVLALLSPGDQLILLDEIGSHFTSVEFSAFLQKKMNTGAKRLVFLIGGAYGFDKKIYDRANGKLALSKMTFTHQMVRLFFLEQIYRAFTILNNEPYHNQ